MKRLFFLLSFVLIFQFVSEGQQLFPAGIKVKDIWSVAPSVGVITLHDTVKLDKKLDSAYYNFVKFHTQPIYTINGLQDSLAAKLSVSSLAIDSLANTWKWTGSTLSVPGSRLAYTDKANTLQLNQTIGSTLTTATIGRAGGHIIQSNGAENVLEIKNLKSTVTANSAITFIQNEGTERAAIGFNNFADAPAAAFERSFFLESWEGQNSTDTIPDIRIIQTRTSPSYSPYRRVVFGGHVAATPIPQDITFYKADAAYPNEGVAMILGIDGRVSLGQSLVSGKKFSIKNTENFVNVFNLKASTSDGINDDLVTIDSNGTYFSRSKTLLLFDIYSKSDVRKFKVDSTGHVYAYGTASIGKAAVASGTVINANGVIRADRVGSTGQYLQMSGGDVTGSYIDAVVAGDKVMDIRNLSTSATGVGNRISFTNGINSAPVLRMQIDGLGRFGVGRVPSTTAGISLQNGLFINSQEWYRSGSTTAVASLDSLGQFTATYDTAGTRTLTLYAPFRNTFKSNNLDLNQQNFSGTAKTQLRISAGLENSASGSESGWNSFQLLASGTLRTVMNLRGGTSGNGLVTIGTLTPASSGTKLIVAGDNGAANLQSWYSGNLLLVSRLDSTGGVGFGAAASTSQLILGKNVPNRANLLDLQSGTGVSREKTDSSGNKTLAGTITTGGATNDSAWTSSSTQGAHIGRGLLVGDRISSGGATVDTRYGVPNSVDSVNWTGQTASIAAQNFSNVVTGHMYRLSYYLYTTTVSTSGGTVSMTISWNDGTAKTFPDPIIVLSSTSSASSFSSGSRTMYVASGSPTWETVLAGVVVGNPQYSVKMNMEVLW